MTHPDLIAHAEQTAKDVIRLTPFAWTAVGYAASNVHMIEGQDTITIIDTTESTKAARNILEEFRKLSEKPIGRIIYTHSHRDHISGASVFVADSGKPEAQARSVSTPDSAPAPLPDSSRTPESASVPIYASALFKSDLIAVDESAIAPNQALARRTQAQFGIGLSDEERISLGCGPGNRPMEGLGAGYVEPNARIDSETEIDLDGVSTKLIPAPGETADHVIVWLPEHRILFGGDNWYHAFPNLYAIRGTPYRDFSSWAASLERMAALEPEILSPGHTRPVFGKEKVQEVLTSTRQAIEHVMRSAAEGMDSGLSMDDLACSASLPEALASKPWLKEFYGRIDWSARAFAVGTLGWYDGNPTHLGTLSSSARARLMAELAGGVDALFEAARRTGDSQWKLELCDHLIALDHPAAPEMKAEALALMAEGEINATARNAFLWEAKRLRRKKEGGK